MIKQCHADGAQFAVLRGPYGFLCSSCWERVAAIVERITGRRPR